MNEFQVVVWMVLMVGVFIVVDVWLAKDKTPGNTYSEIITDTGNRHPWFRALMLWGLGLLSGHWFW